MGFIYVSGRKRVLDTVLDPLYFLEKSGSEGANGKHGSERLSGFGPEKDPF